MSKVGFLGSKSIFSKLKFFEDFNPKDSPLDGQRLLTCCAGRLAGAHGPCKLSGEWPKAAGKCLAHNKGKSQDPNSRQQEVSGSQQGPRHGAVSQHRLEQLTWPGQ